MHAGSWVDQFARELGTQPPTEEQERALLTLASVAAHASERLAAPLSCWLVAVAGRSPEEGLAVARRLAAVMAGPEAGPDAGPGPAAGPGPEAG